MKNESEEDELTIGGGVPIPLEVLRASQIETTAINARRYYEEEVGDEFPEYRDFLNRRRDRATEVFSQMITSEEANAILAAEGFDDEKWQPDVYAKAHGWVRP